MENDLIRRSDLLAKKCVIRGQLDPSSPCPTKVTAIPVDVIERAPAVDAVEVRHGKWENGCVCSNCTTHCGPRNKATAVYYRYCPFCGAKMDLEE